MSDVDAGAVWWQKRAAFLEQENETLRREARGIADITEPFTCDRDYCAGETIPLRIPKRFMPLGVDDNPLQVQLLDLITLMPDSQTQEIVDYIMSLREIRKRRDA